MTSVQFAQGATKNTLKNTELINPSATHSLTPRPTPSRIAEEDKMKPRDREQLAREAHSVLSIATEDFLAGRPPRNTIGSIYSKIKLSIMAETDAYTIYTAARNTLDQAEAKHSG